MRQSALLFRITLPTLLLLTLLVTGWWPSVAPHPAYAASSVNQAFDRASQEFRVPSALLKAACYMEGRLSNHDGSPSIDGGYSCMHLIKNRHGDTLDRAASELGVSMQELKLNMATSIRGGAIVLRDYALQLSHTHSLPANLADWYAGVAAYSNATTS